MKRRSLLFFLPFLLAASTVSANAQEPNLFRKLLERPSRKAIENENSMLKNSLDSLQSVIDSLEQHIYMAENDPLEDAQAIAQSDSIAVEYTAELSDSLLHLWYKTSFSGDIDVVNEYDMDSVRFTSAVSDEEMTKRLENMHSFISLPFNSNVKNYIVLYSERMPTQMGRVLGLSDYYFPIFEEVFNRYGLPLELKYMAVVESMLNPVARSRAGALGMWQFMYNTARNYGLEINSYVDERLNVEKSADAAARYLRDAYKIFGDWALAISSYNCGAGNVSKAIRRAGGKRDFWSIYPFLPRETRGYVPAFVAAMYAMTYNREYGIRPQVVGLPAQTDTFHIRKNLHFKQINEVVGVPVEDLKNLNPQYVHDIIPGNIHSYTLRLPYNWTNAFVAISLDSLYAYKADTLLSEKVVKAVETAAKNPGRTSYKVKSGDYLGKIASKFNVSVANIKRWNNLKSSNIRVGQVLYIYGSSYTPASASSSGAKKSSAKSSAGASGSSKASGSAGKSTSATHTVKSGESLYLIAKKYPGVSAEDIRKHNGLSGNNIRPGQKLKIPAGK